jgi:electron transfer flavoprotein alpha subunit
MSLVVIIEQHDGKLWQGSLETLSACKALIADGFGSALVAVVPGTCSDTAALGAHGATRVIQVQDLAAYSADGWANALAAVIQGLAPKGVFASASVQGRELAARLAARMGLSVIGDCTALEVAEGQLLATRPVFAGKVLCKVRCQAAVALATLRPKVFPAVAGGGSAAVESVNAGSLDMKAVVQEILAAAAGRIDLTEADIIVSGGRGTGGPEGFAPIEALAAKLGAAVGASRAVVDAGWRPHSDQVGQTGKVVNPTLYIACGISGAIQHLAGMKNSRYIVAINKDPEAPIFKVADYGIVGDLFEICPALTAAL